MNRTVAIIQARMGSQRLPGKMMLWLNGYPVIEWVVRRTLNSSRLDDVVVAIPENRTDDILYNFLKNNLKVKVIRGPEDDVLGRFIKAGMYSKATHIVRVCADNPLICNQAIDDLVRFFNNNDCEYAYNQGDSGRTNSYPDGFGAEIVSFSLLEWLHRNAFKAKYREHCLLYIMNHPDQFTIKTFNPPDKRIAHPELKLDLDTLEDYHKLVSKKISIDSNSLEIVKTFLDQ